MSWRIPTDETESAFATGHLQTHEDGSVSAWVQRGDEKLVPHIETGPDAYDNARAYLTTIRPRFFEDYQKHVRNQP